MTEQAKREMTLDEYCAQLVSDHLANQQLAALKAENAELKAQNATFVDALAFYECGTNWTATDGRGGQTLIEQDNGLRAFQVLDAWAKHKERG